MRRLGDGVFDLPRKFLIEMLAGLLQQEAQPVLRQLLPHALADQPGRMIADAVGGLVHPPRRFLAHRQPVVQDPVHRRNTDPGLARQIGNCRPVRHLMRSMIESYHSILPIPD